MFGTMVLGLQVQIAVAVWLVLRFEESDRYAAAFAAGSLSTVVAVAASVRPGSDSAWGLIERFAADGEAPDARALASTYTCSRSALRRTLVAWPVAIGLGGSAAAVLAGAEGSRLIQWTIIAMTLGATMALVGGHFVYDTVLRPVRRAMAGDTAVGDDFPSTRPGYETWSTVATVANLYLFPVTGALLGVQFGVEEAPIVSVAIGLGMASFFGMGITSGMIVGPSLQPLRDLSEGTRRVEQGDFSQRLVVAQDDELGVLAASFNRMQAGLVERERLQSAFGSYVDPSLAQRLIEQGDDLFRGERVEVTVMFVDIRDFTPFAEANTAERTVELLNAIFEITVEVTNAHGGHVNKFLGDGAMIVFGAPDRVDGHADRALAAALEIRRRVGEHHPDTKVGIGVNTGTVIAGTVGGAGKLEFTLIGDAVNIAARVEQLTKSTGDSILLTDATVSVLADRPVGIEPRGGHELKGKRAPVTVHAIGPSPAVEPR